jgi:hypothetical protein
MAIFMLNYKSGKEKYLAGQGNKYVAAMFKFFFNEWLSLTKTFINIYTSYLYQSKMKVKWRSILFSNGVFSLVT